MQLTVYEQEIADGVYGKGLQKAMNILIAYGEACGAERMVEISSAHIMPKEPVELLEEFTEDIEKAAVKTTLHPLMSAFSPEKWKDMGIPEAYAAKACTECAKRAEIHGRLGIWKTYSCLPMHIGNIPQSGSYNSWIGSCAQILANSLLGARTNKDGAIVNLCSALTGRTPYFGLLMDENRYAQVIVRIDGSVKLEADDDFGALGYYVGTKLNNKSVVFDNLNDDITFEQLKYLIAPAAASGSIHICHVVGKTPEAPTLEAALGGREPEEILVVTQQDIDETKKRFCWDTEKTPDILFLGCPHVTVDEAGLIAGLLRGRKLKEGKRLWLAMANPIYALCQDMGYAEVIEQAGGIIANVCMATIPDSPVPDDVKIIATNSFKCAHYVASLQKGRKKVMVSDLETCLKAVTEVAE